MKVAWASLPLAALTLAIGLSACDTVPKPFRHDEGAVAPLARPKLGRGIALRLPDDLPAADPVAEALIRAFEDREIPLTRRHGPAFGRVIEAEAEGGVLLWRLRDADGSEVSRLTTPAEASARMIARQVESRFHPLLEDPDAAPTPSANLPPAPKVRLAAIKGLPGDGDTALSKALAAALERQRITIDAEAGYTVVGVVSVAPAGATEDSVAVSWLVKRGDVGGLQLARIDQGGAVPRGRLNLPWGSLARDIAEGGAASIAEVVRMDERNRQDQENAGGSRQFTETGAADIGKPDSTEQTNAARISPPPEAPAAAPSVPTEQVRQEKPQPAKTVSRTKNKSSATKKTSPAKAKKAKPAPRTKPDR